MNPFFAIRFDVFNFKMMQEFTRGIKCGDVSGTIYYLEGIISEANAAANRMQENEKKRKREKDHYLKTLPPRKKFEAMTKKELMEFLDIKRKKYLGTRFLYYKGDTKKRLISRIFDENF